MGNAWISITLITGKSPKEKGILCDSEDFPMVFNSQGQALDYWMEHKNKMNVDEKYKDFRGSAKPIPNEYADPDTYVDDVLCKENRIIVKLK